MFLLLLSSFYAFIDSLYLYCVRYLCLNSKNTRLNNYGTKDAKFSEKEEENNIHRPTGKKGRFQVENVDEIDQQEHRCS